MSYTRTYSETVVVEGEKDVEFSYGPSQSGGTIKKTVRYRENVDLEFRIQVDTDPYDSQIEDCIDNVNILSATIGATSAAQVASVYANGRRVSGTIVEGFFGLIRSELSQQMAELRQNIDAQIMHLVEMRKACIAKQAQMEADYRRIASRYEKIFHDLNTEMYNRIHELDKPTFNVTKVANEQRGRLLGGDSVTTAIVTGQETARISCAALTSNVRNRAMGFLAQARRYLFTQQSLRDSIQACTIEGGADSVKHVPVCVVEQSTQDGRAVLAIHTPTGLTSINDAGHKEKIRAVFQSKNVRWRPMADEYRTLLAMHMESEIKKAFDGDGAQVTRVRDTMRRLASLQTIQVA